MDTKKTTFISCKSKQKSTNTSLQLLVDEYLQRWEDSYEIEDQWWADQTLTWEEAMARAWHSRLAHGKMHGHQCRVAKRLFEGLAVALADKRQPEDFRDFQTVYDWVKSVVDRVKGLGNTTAYDVARRLGAWLRVEPSVVYLHAGTADGARKLGIEGDMAPLDVFPIEVQSLGAVHAENFLCIYKNQLGLANF